MGVTTDFSISGLGFRLDTPWPVPVTGNFGDFAGGCGRVDWTVTFQEVDSLPDTPGEEVFRNYFLAVYGSEGRYLRRYHSHTDFDRPYAVTDCDWDSGTVRVRYLGGDRGSFAGSAGCFSHIGFEELLIGRGRLILHASLVDSPFGGILFSGASGVGKSTQGELWKRYEGSTVINGDRPILYRGANGWLACGSPYAGSSDYHVNATVPIAAIIMLEQGGACGIRRLQTADAFRNLYAGTVMNSWNAAYMEAACSLLMDLSGSVPVYHLRCTPDKAAVETVKAVLQSVM